MVSGAKRNQDAPSELAIVQSTKSPAGRRGLPESAGICQLCGNSSLNPSFSAVPSPLPCTGVAAVPSSASSVARPDAAEAIVAPFSLKLFGVTAISDNVGFPFGSTAAKTTAG